MSSFDVRQQLEHACSKLSEAQSDLSTACHNLSTVLADPSHSSAQWKRGMNRARKAGAQALRLTENYLSALSAYADSRTSR